jgi:hypothetical protein
MLDPMKLPPKDARDLESDAAPGRRLPMTGFANRLAKPVIYYAGILALWFAAGWLAYGIFSWRLGK